MSRVKVVTDSACDLPQDLVDELGIEIVPLSIRFGAEELVDRRDLTPDQFWARCKASPVLPETAAPAPGAFQTAFTRAADEGCDGVVCVNLSGALSATHQAAVAAASAVADRIPVRTVDSRSVTLGLGLMVLSAARAAAAGKSTEDVAGIAEDLVPRTRVFGALDTLEYLKKGGRIGGAQALFGTMLSIKPIVEVVDGAVAGESKQRTRSRALAYLVDKVRSAGEIEDLGVLTGASTDLEQFLDRIGQVYPRDKIVVGDIGAVIGSHVGPGTIGVTFHVAG
ncbi:MAG TPA: DegV family protein [Acidimicrobiales bacterium]|nr:DegV family protein [Acidimicrobiales bacterium]